MTTNNTNKEQVKLRRFQPEDAEETARLIAKTLRISNSKDYSTENIEANVASHSAEILTERAKRGHMYVACEGPKIIGCGGIAPYWGSTTESILLTIFVLPEYQGKGIGKQIIQTLEQDEFFLRANRIEIPASITAIEFYKKMGYDYKNGIAEVDEEQLCRMEKHR
ncbi:MAG: GNAT family N-acetyltransferase [Lachnospiraceae bacterium]|nr:GNAT family N-acetyltransferase [Lachnospiraceae bacterium]